ncbi:FAD-dependent oxidoreductase [Burkholderia gladioli]|uniref:FAD-dependent oxidoreductase n=1 Tax=Burkholderia gladioli TaxID=28095 RepID=UPI001FC7EA58|nr:FAD-dependent oxidoreductase [Burkholderia gladioli]
MQNYYEASVTRPAADAPLSGRAEARVCVVGGGLAGLSTALGLVERGITDVLVLDAQQVGHGASGRNGGFVFGGYSLDNAELLARLGPVEARRLYGLTLDAVDRIRARVARHGIDCELVDEGVILANWFADPARLDAPRRLMKQVFGVDWEPLAAAELQQRLKTSRYHGGLFERNAFHFHPLKYVLGIARALRQGGARIAERTPVLSIRRRGAGLVVSTAYGEVHAQDVVFAGGGYARGVHRRVERAVLPIATYVIATEPLGARLADAAVSVLAIVGLLLARAFGWLWMDPLAGVIGALVIANWSWGLIRDTGGILLDMDPGQRMAENVRHVIEDQGDTVLDLHVWRVGPGHMSAIVSVATREARRDPGFYRSALARFQDLSHLTIEVNAAPAGA